MNTNQPNDQTRNLNPTIEARIAMTVYGKRYSEQNGGSMDFWDSLSKNDKIRCKMVVDLFLTHYISKADVREAITSSTVEKRFNPITREAIYLIERTEILTKLGLQEEVE